MVFRRFSVFVVLAALLQAPLAAQAYLVKDIYPGVDSNQSEAPEEFTEFNGLCYFSMESVDYGRELWVTDGTPGGTELVYDINPGGPDSNPTGFVVVGALLFFAADDGTNGVELWATDGTQQGTYLVDDINPSGDSSPTDLVEFNGECFFAATDDGTDVELWHSDGTTTTEIVIYANGSADPRDMIEFNGDLYFAATDDDMVASGEELFVYDGVSVTIHEDIEPGGGGSSISSFTVSGALLYFVATTTAEGAELFATDGVTAGIVEDIRAGANGSLPEHLTDVGGTLFFDANSAANDRELWKSDGTMVGTAEVEDQNGLGSMTFGEFVVFQGLLYFPAMNPNLAGDQLELYRSDGTPAGTGLFKNLWAGGESNPGSFFVAGGTLYFIATDASGRELWKSDGTVGGTVIAADINAGAGSSTPASLAEYNGDLIFSATDGTTGREPYMFDGAAASQVLDIGEVANSSSLAQGIVVNGFYYFAADDGTNGVELWRTDGTLTNTEMVADINGGAGDSNPSSLCALNATVFIFAADDGNDGVELWKFDTATDTVSQIADIEVGATGSSPADLTYVNINGTTPTVFFTATTTAEGKEVWKTDGATASIVEDIRAGATGSSPQLLVAYNDYLAFKANDGGGAALWVSTDGTAMGTSEVAVGMAGASNPTALASGFGDHLFFSANGADGNGIEPWYRVGNGMTGVLANIVAAGGSSSPARFTPTTIGATNYVYYAATVTGEGQELIVTNMSTLATTTEALWVGTRGSSPANFTAFTDGSMFFTATSALGVELYRSTGPSMTTLVMDINPDGTSGATNLKLADGRIFLSANDGVNGAELWWTDGTTTGMYQNINMGAHSANPSQLVVTSTHLLFAATSRNYGQELWAIPFDIADIGDEDDYSADEDEVVVSIAPGVLANDSGTTPVVAAHDDISTFGGTVVMAADGSFTYTPPTDISGTDTFSYTVTDTTSGNFDTVTVSITINPVADTPTDATANDISTTENAPVALDITPGAVADLDGSEQYSVIVGGMPDDASIDVGTDLGGGEWQVDLLDIAGAMLDPGDSDMLFTLTIRSRATEQSGGDTEDGAVSTFDVDITATNPDDPELDPIADETAYEGETVSVTATGSDPDTGDSIEYSIDPGTIEPGMTIDDITGEFEWTIPLHAGYDGPMTVTVTIIVTDSFGGTDSDDFDINILAGTPSLNAIGPKSVYETATLSFTAGATDPNPGETFTYSLANAEAGMTIGSTSGVFTWTPAFGFGGTVQTVDVIVTDGGGVETDFETVSITIPVGTPSLDPIGDQTTNEAQELAFTVTTTDPNPGDTFTYSIDFADATIDPDTGEFSWTPAIGSIGDQDITFTVTDSQGETDSETITVTVTVGAPVLTAIPDKSIKEGRTLSFAVSATDPNGDDLTYSLDATALLLGATIGSSTGVFSWIPGDTLGGTTVNITVSVTDGISTVTDTFAVLVVDSNSKPYFVSTPVTFTIVAGNSYSYTVIADDDDVPAQTLTISALLQLPSWITLTSVGDGIAFLTGTPGLSDIGSYDISMRVSDGVDATAQTFVLTVVRPTAGGGSGGRAEAASSRFQLCSLAANGGTSGVLLAMLGIVLIGGSLRRARSRNNG